MDQDAKKKAAAQAAIEIIELEGFIGVGYREYGQLLH